MIPWYPDAASAHAASLDGVLAAVHWHILLVFVAWSAILITAIVRFHARRRPVPGAQAPSPIWPALAIGLVVLGDAVLLAARALPVWSARIAPPPAGSNVLEVRIAAEQFAWNIHYPGPDGRFGRTGAAYTSASNPVGIDRGDPDAADDIGLQNVLTLPVDRTVVIEVTSRDVVHSLTLPEMRVKQDATPGMPARTWFTPTKTGAWEITCSQLCGLGHYRMRGDYRVLSTEDWNRWLKDELDRLR